MLPRSHRPEVQPGLNPRATGQGYAARGGTFTSVSATWTIPHLALDGPFARDATWIGIGGLRSRDLIQAGHPAGRFGHGYGDVPRLDRDPFLTYRILCPLTVLGLASRCDLGPDQQAGDTWLISFTNLTSRTNAAAHASYCRR